MNYEEEEDEAYNSAVNLQWEKLANAQTTEEIQAVLDTWPDKKDFDVDSTKPKL